MSDECEFPKFDDCLLAQTSLDHVSFIEAEMLRLTKENAHLCYENACLTDSRYLDQRDEVQRYGDEMKRHINDITVENRKLREALQLVRLSRGWLHLSEETKTIIIDRLDGGRVL